VELIDSIEKLVELRDEWSELWDSDPTATVFQHPDWLLPWTRHLWGGGKLRVATMRNGSRLVGVAPLFVWGDGRVAWLGSGLSDYLGMTTAPEFADEVARAVICALADMRGEWERCDLEELREDSPLLRFAAPDALRSYGIDARVEECSVCPALCLSEPLPARMVKNLRYAERKLGTFEFVPGEWSDLFRLHQARWEGEGMLRCPHVQAFHREAVGRFVRLCALRVEGKVIAVQYNLVAKDRACYYLSGYDPAYRDYSPGSVLLRHTMEEAAREGARVFDFLRNPEPYKYTWGARDQTNRQLVLTHSYCFPI
jgi:CelD/BcsL family acetyltransferase involved in cellulose biosynthesis